MHSRIQQGFLRKAELVKEIRESSGEDFVGEERD